MTKLSDEHKKALKESSSGLKKVTSEQEQKILELWNSKDPRMSNVEKLVHKTVLFKITGDIKYAPKSSRNLRAEELNKILFS